MIMVNLENHKGWFCAYTPQFCQEGYCSICEIYWKITGKLNRRGGVKLQEITNSRKRVLL